MSYRRKSFFTEFNLSFQFEGDGRGLTAKHGQDALTLAGQISRRCSIPSISDETAARAEITEPLPEKRGLFSLGPCFNKREKKRPAILYGFLSNYNTC